MKFITSFQKNTFCKKSFIYLTTVVIIISIIISAFVTFYIDVIKDANTLEAMGLFITILPYVVGFIFVISALLSFTFIKHKAVVFLYVSLLMFSVSWLSLRLLENLS